MLVNLLILYGHSPAFFVRGNTKFSEIKISRGWNVEGPEPNYIDGALLKLSLGFVFHFFLILLFNLLAVYFKKPNTIKIFKSSFQICP